MELFDKKFVYLEWDDKFVFNGRDCRRRTIKLENICDKCACVVDRVLSDLIAKKGRK